MSKRIELLKKIQELARRGVDGEADNAQKILSEMLNKYNLTIEDLELTDIKDRYFSVKKDDIKMLYQIAKHVRFNIKMYVIPWKIVKSSKLGGNCIIECTDVEFIEITQKFEIYLPLYNKELKLFFSAFCKANNILVVVPETKEQEILSLDDIEEWLRINEMSKSIKSESIVKMLEE